VLDSLEGAIDSGEPIDTEILAALAGGARTAGEVGSEISVPPPVVEERLRRLERRNVIERDGSGWALVDQ